MKSNFSQGIKSLFSWYRLSACILLLLFFFGEAVSAQSSYWKRSNNRARRLAVSDDTKEPGRQYFMLDKVAFARALGGVGTKRASTRLSTIIQIPDADGAMISYRITPTQVLSESVAKENPTIRTFAGQAVENPSKQISFVWSDYGLSGTMVEGFKYSFIEAEDKKGEFYKVYYRQDSKGEIKACETPEIPLEAVKGRAMRPNGTSHRATYETEKKVYTLRFAIACASDFTIKAGGKPQALALITGTIDRINMIYGAQMSVKFELVTGDRMIYDDPNTDPTKDFDYFNWNRYSNSNKLQVLFDTTLGNANYDLGHVFHSQRNNSGNAAWTTAIYWPYYKGRAYSSYSFSGDKDQFDVDIVAHEVGHQLGSYHTFSYNSEQAYGNNIQVEPGSASTIMGYPGLTSYNVQGSCDPYFNHQNVSQMTGLIEDAIEKGLPISYAPHNNSRPKFDDANFKDYTIPIGTAYLLEGIATDTVGDNLLYTWEQADNFEGPFTPYAFSPNLVTGPLARSLPPSSVSHRYIPRLPRIVAGELTQTSPASGDAWETVPMVARQMHWSFVVTDRPFVANQTGNTAYKTITVTVADTAGPFVVTSHEDRSIWRVGKPTTITWDVANTNTAPVSTDKVDILFSTDNGLSFPHTLVTGVPNNGTALVSPTEEMRTSQGRFMIKANGNIFLAVNKGEIYVLNEGENISLPDGALLISNAFTPNEDGINDTYVIARAENFPNNTLQVYNTLGQLVYEAKGYKNQWDGKMSNGEKVARGSYLVIFSTDGSDEKKQKTWIYINY